MIPKEALGKRLKGGMPTLVAILIALLGGGLIMVILGHDPITAYTELVKGAFWGAFNFGGTLERFTTLILSGLAFTVAATAGVFNIGVEGQLYLGAFAATWVGLIVKGLLPAVHVCVAMLAALLVGALWAMIPGVLKAYCGANEICTSIMLNYVAILLTSYLVNGPFSAGTGTPETRTIAASAVLPWILPPSRANVGLFIAVATVFLAHYLVYRTTLGYELRAVGLNVDFAGYSGIRPRKALLWAVALSGAIGGLAGAVEILGVNRRFIENFSPGYGFDGIVVGTLAANRIGDIPLFALLLASLKAGAIGMERFTGVPKELIGTIEAMFIILAASRAIFEVRSSGPETKSPTQ